jgi:hypothetical protein
MGLQLLSSCQCECDGYCQRFQRPMIGRMREICAGVNVDLGTAAAFREQWMRERGVQQTGPLRSIHLLLKQDQAPGDALAMTAAIYSLHKGHPGRYTTAVQTNWPEVFDNNPDVVPLSSIPDAAPLQMHYPAIHQSNDRGIHFMQGWCEFLGSALGINVPLLTNRPHLYFADPECIRPSIDDYWVICSGGKSDFTNKMWGQHNYQEVVDRIGGRVKFVQVGANPDDHPPLTGLFNHTVGRTSLRSLFYLVRWSRGVLCGVSLLMHVAAALGKPAVVIAGGREPVQWNAYPKQHYLHTVGALSCSTSKGDVGGACWRSRVVPLGDGSVLDRDTCERPVNGTPTRISRCTIPECMTLIRPAEVAELVLRYNRGVR